MNRPERPPADQPGTSLAPGTSKEGPDHVKQGQPPEAEGDVTGDSGQDDRPDDQADGRYARYEPL